MQLPQLAQTLLPILRENLKREYPNKQGHVLLSKSDLQAPQERTPLFYGCFDWHSAVHSYASLVRLCRLQPEASWVKETIEFLNSSFSEASIQAEFENLNRPDSATFEMPYGIAWLLVLCRELRLSTATEAKGWHTSFEKLETLAATRMTAWLKRLSFPIRTGEHTQTAFSMCLAWDFAQTAQEQNLQDTLRTLARQWYGADKNAPTGYEPSAHDFLSPSLCEAALMARVEPADEFSKWLGDFLPPLQESEVLFEPVTAPDRNDGKLVHLDGLNISRSWMLQTIIAALREQDARKEVLALCQKAHAQASSQCLEQGSYAGTHWLGTFMLYNLTPND
jgi:hypothetical protein